MDRRPRRPPHVEGAAVAPARLVVGYGLEYSTGSKGTYRQRV